MIATLVGVLIVLWLAGVGWLGWLLIVETRTARARDLDRATDEAIALTHPIGPEDDPTFWGTR